MIAAIDNSELAHYAMYANAGYGRLFWRFQVSTLHNPSRHHSLQSRIQSLGGVLLYADMKNKVCQAPWFIAYDIYADAIVISIRGSKTAKDVATDCKTQPALLHYSDKGQTKTILAHRGIAIAASHIYNTLCDNHVFDVLFHHAYYDGILTSVPDYIRDSDHNENDDCHHRSFSRRWNRDCPILSAAFDA